MSEHSMGKDKANAQYIKMTETPIAKLLIKLSIPTILTMLISNIYSLVDTAFVGTLGTSQSGAIGIVFGYMSILQAIGFMFGQGGGSLMSRRLGAKDVDGASRAASVGFFFALIFATVTAAISYVFLDWLVIKLGSTVTIAPYAKIYIEYILLAAPFVVTSFTLNNILRYEGKALLGMIGMITGAVLNIGGDALLIFVFKMGVHGAGISTAVSQFISFCILISMFLFGKTQTKLSLRLALDARLLWEIILIGFPSMLRQGLNSLATVMLNYYAARYGGDPAVSAMSNVARVAFLAFSVALGIGQGFQPISAYNYGAGKYSRVREGFKVTVLFTEAVLAVLTVGLIWQAPWLMKLMRDDPKVIEIGIRALRLLAIAQMFIPFCMITEMLLQSTGKKLGASLLSAMRGGILFIPCLVIMAAVRGLSGIQEAQPLAYVISVIPSIIYAVWFFHRLPKTDVAPTK